MAGDRENKDHDYVARVKVRRANGKDRFRYFYTMDEYKAYLKGSKSKVEEDKTKKSSDKTSSNKNVSKEYLEELEYNSRKNSSSKGSKKSAKEISKNGKDFVEKLTKKQDNTSNKNVSKEYLEELEYNSRKNELSESSKKSSNKDKKESKEDKKSLSDKEKSGKSFVDKFIAKNGKKLLSSFNKTIEKAKESIDEFIDNSKNFLGKLLDNANGFTKYVAESVDYLFKKKLDTSKLNKKIPTKKDDASVKKEKDNDMLLVNPNNNSDSYGFYETSNFTAAYELRRRGYDVEASTHTDSHEDASRWYENPDVYTMKTDKYESSDETINDLKDSILTYGDGSRGYMELNNYMSIGIAPMGKTSLTWEVENGKVIIRDFKNNRKFDISEGSKALIDAEEITFFRTDNLEIRDSIRKAVKNR